MGAVRSSYNIEVQMETEQCVKCGIVFGIPSDRRRVLLAKRTAESFYCPNGHVQHYVGESDRDRADRLQREIGVANSAKQFAERRLADEQERRRKELARIARRAKAGVCPCCKRTVSQMARHMKTKHPEYGVGPAK